VKKILIVDDAELNRAILSEVFKKNYIMIEAEDGEMALEIIETERDNLCLVFLDLLMPKKSGMDVLEYMYKHDLTSEIPVIVITGNATIESDVKAYEYGAADVIYKPFSRRVISRRAQNIIELYENRKDMERKLEERTAKLKKNSEFLVNALSSVVEFRSLESGEHVQRVQQFTSILLRAWVDLNPECGFTESDISQMINASALHDIGKIAIPDDVLLKPGRLTNEEFAVMKTHTTKGCEILERFKQEDSDFYQYCYDICRYHHEKYDGKGYPDGLSGDDIPVWAQIVSAVDVYDALVSPRVYKDPFPIEEALRMIHDGECGTFNPKIIQCLDAAKDRIIKITKKYESVGC